MAARVADAMLAGMPSRDWVGLFALEHRLHIAQDFTRDRGAARAALATLAQRPVVVKDASATQSTRTGIDLDPSVSPPSAPSHAGARRTSFYPVDAAGLRAHSAVAATAREQDYAGRVALGDEGRSQGAWTRDLEKQADLVRSDGTASLARLAKETGGLLLENSNSIDRIARRIAEDQASHYLLAYAPVRGEMDGTYRRVMVKVKRRGANATHRSGYWAVASTP